MLPNNRKMETRLVLFQERIYLRDVPLSTLHHKKVVVIMAQITLSYRSLNDKRLNSSCSFSNIYAYVYENKR